MRRVWLGGAATVAFGWWFSGLESFTVAKLAALAVPVVAVGVLAFVPHATTGHRWPPSSVLPWAVLLGLTALWAVITWSLEPRSRYPTASSLVGEIDGSQGARLVLFLIWVGLGLVIARR